MKKALHLIAQGLTTKTFSTFKEELRTLLYESSCMAKHSSCFILYNNSLSFLLSTDFYIVMPTKAEHIMKRYCARTDTTLPMFKNARTEFHVGRTVAGKETKISLVFCRHYNIEVIPMQKFKLKILTKMFSSIVFAFWLKGIYYLLHRTLLVKFT